MMAIQHTFSGEVKRLQFVRDGEIVGTARFDCQQTLSVFVLPHYRRQGIATRLMMEASRVWFVDRERRHYTREGADFFAFFFKVAGLRPSAALTAPLEAARKLGCSPIRRYRRSLRNRVVAQLLRTEQDHPIQRMKTSIENCGGR